NSDFVTEPGGEKGLKGEYFNNQELNGTPARVRVDPHIHFDWGEGSFATGEPVDHFSVRWSGYFIPKVTADYQFFTSADDGIRFYVGDDRLIDDWQPHSQTLDAGIKRLEAGQPYKIRLEYFEDVGSAIVGFGVTRADSFVGNKTKAVAANADVVIICVGFDPKTEGEGADRTFELVGGQDELIRQISAVNKNTIVVLNAGGNVDMTQWIDKVPAVLHGWYPGQEGRSGISANPILVTIAPLGSCQYLSNETRKITLFFTTTILRKAEMRVQYSEGVFLGYRHFDRSTIKPLFPLDLAFPTLLLPTSPWQNYGECGSDDEVCGNGKMVPSVRQQRK